MKSGRILLVCYYFPPLGGAGVGRPLALYKYLPKFGYNCDVLTVKPVAYRFYEPDLLEGVETSHVYRSGSRDPQRLMYLLGMRTVKESTIQMGRGMGDRMFPDPKKGWVRSAVKLGRVLAENRHYDAVISTSPPISSHLVGSQLASEFNIPWIADFRDFWTLYKAEDWFTDASLKKRAGELLKKITTKANQVTVVNPAIAEYLKTGTTIYNGFDRELAKLWSEPADRDRFGIGILGTLDKLRPVEPLFKALAAIREKRPELFSRVRLVQVGPIHIESWEQTLRDSGMQNIVTSYPQTKRAETIKLLSDSSMLYLGLSDSAAGLLPIRLFDMIASGRPMLVSAPSNSVVSAIVGDTQKGLIFSADDTCKAVDYLSDLLDRAMKGNLKIEPLPEYAEKYSSEKMAESFARLLKRITST
ncbi:MAG TPA: hypothetical protein VJ983_08855 [candidate division Zixibacteria bacterium]|nr:hypothetical protein [candidate division Zixibacteria bacterium]